MRTTYKYKNTKKNVAQTGNSPEPRFSEPPIQTPLSSSTPTTTKTQSVNIKPKSKLNIGVIVMSVVFLIAIIVVRVLFVRGILIIDLQQEPTEVEIFEENVSELQRDVDALYTNSGKEALAEGLDVNLIDEYFARIPENSGDEKCLDIEDELVTIQLFYIDNSNLSYLEDREYDLTNENFTTKLDGVKENLQYYSVEGLYNNIEQRCIKLEEKYKKFRELETELLSITDYLKCDVYSYIGRVMSINHKPNKEYLKGISQEILQKHIDALVQEEIKKIPPATPTDATSEENTSEEPK